MNDSLYYSTVTPLLRSVLVELMSAVEFGMFRLVGGTALSLQRGHRISEDIDLFTDSKYGSVNFHVLERFLKVHYPYVDSGPDLPAGIGKSYYVGIDERECIKLDLFYTDAFIDVELIIDGIRMATVEEIIAMKVDVVSRGGRKKDFWDLHEVMNEFTLKQMLALHKKRYPYNHSGNHIRKKFVDFRNADQDFDPVCLKGKHWELVKLDLVDFVKGE